MKMKLQNSLERMQNQLLLGVKPEKINGKTTGIAVKMTDQDLKRLKSEIKLLSDRIAGVKKVKAVKSTGEAIEKANPWVIDIYSVKYGYASKAAKKASKGKSKKTKMKRVKSISLVKTVTSQPGMLQRYKDGLMGISPKNHVFKMRNTATQPFI